MLMLMCFLGCLQSGPWRRPTETPAISYRSDHIWCRRVHSFRNWVFLGFVRSVHVFSGYEAIPSTFEAVGLRIIVLLDLYGLQKCWS